MPDEGWDENNPLQATIYGMPDIKDETTILLKYHHSFKTNGIMKVTRTMPGLIRQLENFVKTRIGRHLNI